MKRDIDQNLIKISGKFEINRKIELGEDVGLRMKACCVKIEVCDNQDGTANVTYVCKPLELEIKD